MRIAIIDAEVMGSTYGGHLSLHNEVYLVDISQSVADQVNESGLRLLENRQDVMYHPTAVASTEGLGETGLVILFAKALFSRAVPSANQGVIGLDIYVLALQSGSGHEDILSESVDQEHIIISATEDNDAVLEAGYVRHGGGGKTSVGMLTEDRNDMSPAVKASFDYCDSQVWIRESVQELIWDRLMTNVPLSTVTGALQVRMGYVAANPYVWNSTSQLVKETVAAAGGLGLTFDEEEVLGKVRATSRDNPEGITSICADIVAGRKTEVGTISSFVVRAAQKSGVSVPTHKMIVNIIHALGGKEAKTP